MGDFLRRSYGDWWLLEAVAAGGDDTDGPAVESDGPAVELLFDGIATTGLPTSPTLDPLPLPKPPPMTPLAFGALRLFRLLVTDANGGPEILPPPPLPLGPAP